MSLVLDTHTAIWYLENSEELSRVARASIESTILGAENVYVSAISLIETVYLVERNRLPVTALQRLQSALVSSAGLLIVGVDLSIANALGSISRSAVPDMPDRIIAATALHLGLPLVTRDRRLQSAGLQTIW